MKILLLDIETAPNIVHVWGLFNQNIALNQIVDAGYVMCFAAKWLGEEEIIFRSAFKDKDEMIKTAHFLLDQADAVVHYNGTRFDIPTLNKEFILAKINPPDPYHQIDLLKVARNQFKFASNKLDYISKELGYDGKLKHRGHGLWVRCMANDPKAWADMEAYNKQDVVLLEQLYLRFLPWIKNHPNHGLYSDDTRPMCPNCGSVHVVKKGVETTKTQVYQRYRCVDCGTPLRGRFTIVNKEKRGSILKS